MAASVPLRERLMAHLQRLPEDRLREVLDFTEYLLVKEGQEKEPQGELDPSQDPILELVGLADVPPFSHIIDSELYEA